jgi:hypothetical protein
MSVLTALADGCQRVLRAPVLIAGLWLTYLTVPSSVGITTSDALLGLIDASAIDPIPALASVLWRDRAMLLHGVLFTFLLGGMMDRLARDRATATFGFFGAAGMFFFRFVRLDALALPVYAALLLVVQPRLQADAPVNIAIVSVLTVAVHAVFDVARVRMVVEDRRSAIGALAAGLRFVRRNPAAVFAVTILNAVLAGGTWWLGATFDVGSTAAVYAYFAARALLRLVFVASLVALFQRRLAHAGYTARRIATWPDSPAAEAVLPR